MTQLLMATMNAGKIREFERALEGTGIEIHGLGTLEDQSPVEETGRTFEANARLKAEQYSLRTDMPVLADDSGIEVDALDGAPGVLSARFGGPGMSDEDRNRHLLDQVREVTDPAKRTARFRCVLAVARRGDTMATFDGVVEGRLLEAPRGDNGFGYDPLFFYPPADCTTAEMPLEEKQKISHRGRAIAAFLAALRGGDRCLAGLVDAPGGR